MTLVHQFIEPTDVLYLRANKLFGDPGSHGEALVPPWPSVVAGALRSHILVQDGTDLAAFAKGDVSHPQLGTPAQPGPFMLSGLSLARRLPDGSLETLHALPGDLVVSEAASGVPTVFRLQPYAPVAGIQSSQPLEQWPVLAEASRKKPSTGWWIRGTAWSKYLQGQRPSGKDLVHSADLWKLENRVGIGLSPSKRAAADGQLFSAAAVSFLPGVGLMVSVHGVGEWPGGLLRLGGDGRSAKTQALPPSGPSVSPLSPETLSKAGRCRMVLSTPGIFAGGYLPHGFYQDGGAIRFQLQGVTARLVCAAVTRSETVSGWDLARWQPKAAQKATPTGSVYWLEDLQGSPEALSKLAKEGLWSESCEDPQRRAEGFNRFEWAVYDCR